MTFIKYDDHIEEHRKINEMFKVDCDTLTVNEHLNLHLEYQYKTGKLTEDQYKKYKQS